MKNKFKRSLLLLLILSLVLVVPLGALAEKPGDTVTLTYKFAPPEAYYSFNMVYTLSEGLEFVSMTDSLGIGETGTGGKFAAAFGAKTDPITMTLTAKVKEGVTTDQTMSITGVQYGIRVGRLPKLVSLNPASKTIKIDAPEVPEVWGEWKVKTPATCGAEGVEVRTSDKGTEETRPIPKKDHDWGEWTVKTPATCTEKGVEERVCKADATHKETRDIAPLGHNWGEWTVKTPATCTEKGVEERVCKTDATHKETCDIAALGHNWGEWTVKTPATCTVKGVEERVCKNDATHKETRDIAMLAHKEGPWVVLREPTKDKPGERVKYCTVGGEVLKKEEIPFITRKDYPNNTASTQGIRFRDISPDLTKKWYMFTPVDLSQDGEQIIPVIASNIYYIGQVKLTVAGGQVTVTPEILKGVTVKSSFLTFFTGLDAVTEVEPGKLTEHALPFGEAVSIEEVLGGDTNALLYAHFVVDYHDEVRGIKPFHNSSKEYKALVQQLTDMMQ